MSVQLRELYGLYAELEAIPLEAERAEKVRAEKWDAALTAASRAERAVAERHARAVATTRSRRQFEHDDLESRLRGAAQSASGKGALLIASASGTGGVPDFAGMQRLDVRLGNEIAVKQECEALLTRLHEQLDREAGRAKARKHDMVTISLLAVGALLSILVGASLVGALLGIVSALAAEMRLRRGPSAYMYAMAEKVPSIAYDARLRGSISRILAAWGLLGTLVLNAIVSMLLSPVHPFWNEDALWRWVPFRELGTPGFGAYVMGIFFWFAFGYAIILLITGYARRGGR